MLNNNEKHIYIYIYFQFTLRSITCCIIDKTSILFSREFTFFDEVNIALRKLTRIERFILVKTTLKLASWATRKKRNVTSLHEETDEHYR